MQVQISTTFNNETHMDEGCFGVYRRRSPAEGGHAFKKRVKVGPNYVDVELDNRWIVPYSPYLLKRFGCHINMEFCATVVAVKYLFLYHFKGGDKVTIEEQDMRDEVKKFQTRRYLSACEAAFRICFYPMVRIEPTVKQMTVHLPNEQQVYFEPTKASATDALRNASITMLTAFFEANSANKYCTNTETYARDLKYEEFPDSFVWTKDNEGRKCWKPRQKGKPGVGRMISIHPTKGETFYLRLLLKHRKGSTSYVDLRTVDETEHETYHAACIALDLCEDDTHWFDTLDEANMVYAAKSIRELFANILLNCNPSQPELLFETYQDCMKDDFVRKRQQTMRNDDAERVAYNDLLLFINAKCNDAGVLNSHFRIPMPEENEANDNPNEVPPEEVDHNAEEYVASNQDLLTGEQQHVCDRINQSIESNQPGLFRLDSPGGTGKTFTSNYLLASVRMTGHIAIATALSGIAATLLTQGTTFHKRFGAPIPCFKDSVSKMQLQSIDAEIIRQAELIIIDEVSMMSFKLLDVLDRLLQELMENNETMGGKTVLLMYDFRQLLPVVPGRGRADVVSETVLNSSIWRQFEELSLHNNMRVQRMIDEYPEREAELRQHEQWLLDIGTGEAQTAYDNIIEIPDRMVCTTQHELEENVYDNFKDNYNDTTYLRNRAIMSTTNNVIQQCNFDMINQIPGELVVSTSIDKCVEDNDTTLYDEAVLNKVNVSGIPPHRLALKVGACIILIKNLNVRQQHCNGTRYIIQSMTNRLIAAKRLTDDELILIPRIPMVSQDSNFPVPFKRLQFPVLGAYYLTINRAQGQTLHKSGLYLERSVFTHGAFYVSMSRGGAPWGKYIYANQEEFAHLDKHLDNEKYYTRNIVYKEVFT